MGMSTGSKLDTKLFSIIPLDLKIVPAICFWWEPNWSFHSGFIFPSPRILSQNY